MKKVGYCYYAHRWSIHGFPKTAQDLIFTAFNKLPIKFHDYAIVKVDMKTESVSFIRSYDFDTAREPTVGNGVKVSKEGIITYTKEKGQIYHHKWMFVEPLYNGFDVEESKEWSRIWQEKIPCTREIKSRIGYRKYWVEILRKYDIN